MDENRLKVGLGFATGRKSFQNVLRSYVYHLEESGFVVPGQVSLTLLVAFDPAYSGASRADYEDMEPPRAHNAEEDIEDELDPLVFVEEQPEDSFLQRSDKAPGAASADDKPERHLSDRELWEAVCKKAEPELPMDLRMYLKDSSSVEAVQEGAALKLLVKAGFIYGRFNKPEVIAKLSAAASSVSGREMRVLLGEKQEQQPRQKRELEELKAFKEVRFI